MHKGLLFILKMIKHAMDKIYNQQFIKDKFKITKKYVKIISIINKQNIAYLYNYTYFKTPNRRK